MMEGGGGAGVTPADKCTTPETCPTAAGPSHASVTQETQTAQGTVQAHTAAHTAEGPGGVFDRRGSHHPSLQRSAGDKQAARYYQVLANILHVCTADSLRLLFALKGNIKT